ncbi:hypothetical protein LSH36_89g07060 [Paralvinella palmiformis]|uniref:Calpain catalytic domain-containing protein n=1 Tax=Paralvinella palmiformis TaxID=53620 RepID=A0AAD9K1C6_9ANNE|nr:hypothetical protein LSH36_89g07060 [Paralvinella palmiformis]
MTSYSQKTTRTVYYSHGGPGQNQVMETTVRSGGDGATTETHRTTYSSDEPGLFLDSNFGGLNINASGFGPGRFTSSIAKPLNLRYSRGWSSKKDNSTRRGLAPMKLKGKTYAEIKQQCLAEGRLFEDPDFPAQNSSIFYSEMPARSFVWKRPPTETGKDRIGVFETGETRIGVAGLTKSTSPKWELSELIRIGRLTSPKRSEHERRRRQNKIVQTSPIIVQANVLQYCQFVGKRRLCEALARPT